MITASPFISEAHNRANAKAIRDRLLYGGRKVAEGETA